MIIFIMEQISYIVWVFDLVETMSMWLFRKCNKKTLFSLLKLSKNIDSIRERKEISEDEKKVSSKSRDGEAGNTQNGVLFFFTFPFAVWVFGSARRVSLPPTLRKHWRQSDERIASKLPLTFFHSCRNWAVTWSRNGGEREAEERKDVAEEGEKEEQ